MKPSLNGNGHSQVVEVPGRVLTEHQLKNMKATWPRYSPRLELISTRRGRAIHPGATYGRL